MTGCCEWMFHEKPQASILLKMDLTVRLESYYYYYWVIVAIPYFKRCLSPKYCLVVNCNNSRTSTPCGIINAIVMIYIIIIYIIIIVILLYYCYYFKLLKSFRQQNAYSKENFCKPRGPEHTYKYIVVIIVRDRKEDKMNAKWSTYSTLKNSKLLSEQSHSVTE